MAGPFTPSKQHPPQSHCRLQDSPFSDYFTDEGRSTRSDDADDNDGERHSASPSEARQILARLAQLQSQLKGDGGVDRRTLRLIEAKMTELDRELVAVQPQTRIPPDMEDSGLFMDDGEADELGEDLTPEQRRAEADFLLLEAQRGLASVSKAQDRLRQCHQELRDMHTAYENALDDHERRVQLLYDDIDSLKTELALTCDDLDSLQPDYEALQMTLLGLCQQEDEGRGTTSRSFPECRGLTAQRLHSRVGERTEHWWKAWTEVSARVRQRRNRYGLPKQSYAPSEFYLSSTHESDYAEGHEDVTEQQSITSNGMDEDTVEQDDADGEEDTVLEPSGSVDDQAAVKVAHYIHSSTQTTPEIKDKDGSVSAGEEVDKSIHNDTLGGLGILENIQASDEDTEDEEEEEEEEDDDDGVESEDNQFEEKYEHTRTNEDNDGKHFNESETRDMDMNETLHAYDSAKPTADEIDGAKKHESNDHIRQYRDDDDCAITSSSEADEDDESDGDSVTRINHSHGGAATAPPVKQTSAWQDLWYGLTTYVGLGDERFDTLAEYSVDD